MRYLVLAVALVGCAANNYTGDDLGGHPYDLSQAADETSAPDDMAKPRALAVQYSVTSPYQISGSSADGSDGPVYSSLPCSPLACDPWRLTFCYQAICFTLSDDLAWIPFGETVPIIPGNGTLVASGSVSCSSWTGNSTITWFDATPLHWHVAISANCTDGSVSFAGDWKRID